MQKRKEMQCCSTKIRDHEPDQLSDIEEELYQKELNSILVSDAHKEEQPPESKRKKVAFYEPPIEPETPAVTMSHSLTAQAIQNSMLVVMNPYNPNFDDSDYMEHLGVIGLNKPVFDKFLKKYTKRMKDEDPQAARTRIYSHLTVWHIRAHIRVTLFWTSIFFN